MKFTLLSVIALSFVTTATASAQNQSITCIAHTNGGQRQNIQANILDRVTGPQEMSDYNGHKVAIGWVEKNRTLVMIMDGYTSVVESHNTESIYRITAPDGAELMCVGRTRTLE